MNYLVDANVLSETTRRSPNTKVLNWLDAHLSEAVVDPIILGELSIGVLALPGGRKRSALKLWLANVVERIDCLAWDAQVASVWARLVVELRRRGEEMATLDSMIAATALAHELVLVTHNVRDFRRTGVRLLDPFV